MKTSAHTWLLAFTLLPVLLFGMSWVDPLSVNLFGDPPSSNLFVGGYFMRVVIWGGFIVFFVLTIFVGYDLKKSIIEDINFINDQYYLTNNRSCGIKAVQIETCNLERKYYVYAAKCEDPTILSYRSEGFIRSIWSCTKSPEGQMLIVVSLLLLSIYCFMSNFGDISLSFFQYFGVSYAVEFFYIFIIGTMVKKYTISNNSKKKEKLLQIYNNDLWMSVLRKVLSWSAWKKALSWSSMKEKSESRLKRNLCYIIKKDSLDKYEEKFNIKNNLFYIVGDNSDYVFYYTRPN